MELVNKKQVLLGKEHKIPLMVDETILNTYPRISLTCYIMCFLRIQHDLNFCINLIYT